MQCPFCFEHKQAGPICEHCAFDESVVPEPPCLPFHHSLASGRYWVGTILGSPGGFGVAYKAWDNKHHTAVVIKEFLGPHSDQVRRLKDGKLDLDSRFRQNFKRALEHFRIEAERIQEITDPHIVRVIRTFAENNTLYYVMPFVEGHDLNHRLVESGPRLSPELTLKLAHGALLGLRAMHDKGQIHCDVKPSNILLETAGSDPPQVKLIDFGAVRRRGNSEQLASNYTEAYAAPELIANDGSQIRESTDIFLLAATLYKCLTGQPPPSAPERLLKGHDPYVSIGARVPGLPAGLVQLIDRGLELVAESRPQSATEALSLLPPLPAPPPPPPPPREPVGVARLLAGVSGVACLVALLAGQPAIAVVAGLAFVACVLAILKPWRRPPPVLRLSLTSEGMASIVQEFTGPAEVTVGRLAQNTISIPDNKRLSGHHVKISIDADGFFTLTDMHSKNHTFAADPRQDSPPAAWQQITNYSGQDGRFMLGLHDMGGVLLEIEQRRGRR